MLCSQVIGSLPCVQDALFQITGRLRETFYPVKPYHSNVMGAPHMEMPPPSFKPRHDPASSPVGPFEPPPPFLHGVDHHHHHHHHLRPNYPYSYGNERQGYGGRWNSEVGSFLIIEVKYFFLFTHNFCLSSFSVRWQQVSR